MSYFHSSITLILFAFFFFFMIDGGYFVDASIEIHENALMELSSREDMVQMAGYGEEKLSTVIVTGSLLCEACFHGVSNDHLLQSWPLSGALVGIDCYDNTKNKRSSRVYAYTDEFGDFTLDLPSDLHAIPDLERTCSVRILRMSKNSHCQPAYISNTNKGMRLSSVGNGIREYTAGKLSILHGSSRPLEACMKKEDGHQQRSW